jgi:alkylhydroperoxidase/carboxymuconolactone decarboxylase family protein YurZ
MNTQTSKSCIIMGTRKINLGTWANDLKAKNTPVGELRFSHINWASHVEFNAKITVNMENIGKFQKELEALLSKYHVDDIWAEKRAIDEKLRKQWAEESKSDLQKWADKIKK